MKYRYALISCLLLAGTFASYADTSTPPFKVSAMTIKMNINGQQFVVNLSDNPAAKAFMNILPLQLGMEELNGNEKFADLPHALPSSSVRPGFIQAGDLMLYGKQTLVLFYTSFESSYRYTPIGKVVNPERLSAVIGTNKASVVFNSH
ncbi:cyclophilin-like fold protein [Serratia sp. NPDC078593]|uniref:cyclophilin-like fold protein n=1 Tax=unclassified Serratia (in: enterobacteria) TaxID=2647522 RepID=UPI0037D576E9